MAMAPATETQPPNQSLFPAPGWLPRIALVRLLTQPIGERTVYPRMYLVASHQVFAITLIITWVLTLIWFPDQIFEHPARRIIDSFNPCFGWDYPPASFIGITFCSVNVYLTWRWAYFEQIRTLLMSPEGLKGLNRSQVFSRIASKFLAVSSNTWLLLWVLGPNADKPGDHRPPTVKMWMIHTGLFAAFALASYLSVLGNFLEVSAGPHSHVVQFKHKAFVVVYGISVSYLVFIYFYDLIMFKPEHGSSPTPGVLNQIADFFWIGCVMATQPFTPPELPLLVKMEICTDSITDEEELKSLMA